LEQEIELREIFQILRKKAWLILLITGLALAASAVVSFYFLQPVYRASTTLMVIKKEQTTIDYNTIMLNRQLVKTYGRIIQSRTVSEAVIQQLRVDLTPTELQKRISVSPLGDTEIIQIDVDDPSPLRAQLLANKIAAVFMMQIGDIMQVENVSVIDPAIRPDAPYKPRPMMNMAIAGVLGLMVAVGLVFLLEYMDNTIKTPDDVMTHLGLPVLGGIPHIDMAKEQRRSQRARQAEEGVQ
jgi:capsular polysaccharide biosynthesis protein